MSLEYVSEKVVARDQSAGYLFGKLCHLLAHGRRLVAYLIEIVWHELELSGNIFVCHFASRTLTDGFPIIRHLLRYSSLCIFNRYFRFLLGIDV